MEQNVLYTYYDIKERIKSFPILKVSKLLHRNNNNSSKLYTRRLLSNINYSSIIESPLHLLPLPHYLSTRHAQSF